jgi:outer membrane protein assembly factor BamD
LLAAALAALLAGCGPRNDVIRDTGPQSIYDAGVRAMDSNNYQAAITYFQQLESRYPFSNLTRQAQLDMIYVYWRDHQPESAIDAAEQFERENPTHPRLDYCLYMKGVVYFDQAPNVLEKLFKVDLTQRPPKDTMLAFSSFQELMRRFPDSGYASDARERMVFLRNRLAAYENHVANFYMERGAFVAAANRAKYAVEHYSGAPQLEESLQIMVDAYQRLGMDDLAADAQRVLNASFGEESRGELSSRK